MVSSGMLRNVTLVRAYVSEGPSASFIRVTRIGELGTTLAVTSNRRTLRSVRLPPKRRFLQDPHGVTSQNTSFFNIKMDLLEIGLSVVDWIGLAQDRYRWRALVNSVMNLRVP
jgi:hypothetical protein